MLQSCLKQAIVKRNHIYNLWGKKEGKKGTKGKQKKHTKTQLRIETSLNTHL